MNRFTVLESQNHLSTNLNAFVRRKKVPNLLLGCLGLETLKAFLNIATVVLMLVTVASGVNSDLDREMAEVGIEAEDVSTTKWDTAVTATGIYIASTGNLSVVNRDRIFH